MSPLSKREIAFIRHALGLENAKVGYRNRYLAAGEAIDVGNALVKRGMAVEGHEERNGSRWFIITAEGFRAAAKPGERMDREEAEHMAAWGVVRRHLRLSADYDVGALSKQGEES